MATPNVGILTTAGKALIDKVNSGQAKISFSKIVFSSMDNSQLSDTQIKALTAIAPQEVVVSSPETTLDTNSGETRIRATGTNEKLADGVYVKTYGVFAKDDAGNEILYGVTVSPNPNYFPAYDGVTPQAVTYSYKVNISNTSNITFTNSNDIYVSDTDLAEALQPYAKTVDVNQQLDKKVVDNKDGTEQLNGVRVQPFNKLSDTIGGRNLVMDSEQEFTGKAYAIHAYNLAGLPALTPGKTYTMSFSAKVDDKAVNCNQHLFVAIYNPSWSFDTAVNVPISTDYQRATNTFTVPEGQTGVANIMVYLSHPVINGNSDSNADNSDVAGTGYIKELKLEKGSVATDWTAAPEDKVNVADMRKPASDVAGIDEVNAKQDKIGYTPADDSTVLHNNTLNQILTDDSGIIIGNDKDFGFIKRENYKGGLATGCNNSFHFMTTSDSTLSNTSLYHDVWNITNDGKVSILGGASFTPADDSKVVHNTGNEEIAGTKTFDTAPIDKTTGNPYITKDGVPAVPSTLADTTKPANFTAGLQSGGVDVATAAELKSIEDSAWRPLTLENANNGAILFKDNGDGTASLTGSANFVIAADSGVITEAIYPPSGYQFSSLAWNKGVNGNGIYAIGGRSGTSGGSIYTPSAFIDNGKICFKGGSYSYPELMFSPCLNTTDKTSSSCEPAIVGITKV